MLKNNIKKLSGKALIGMGIYVLCKWIIIIGLGSYLYRNGLWHNGYFLVFPLLALVVLYVRKKKKQQQEAKIK